MREVITSIGPGGAIRGGALVRTANQAARELLLAQSSDWPFLLRMGTAGEYPAVRARDHLAAAERLIGALGAGQIREEAFLAARESQFNLFPQLDALPLFQRR